MHLLHAETQPLPWIADNASEICSFALDPFGDAGAGRVLLFDAHGEEVAMSVSRTAAAAVLATAEILGGLPEDLTFLPVSVRA
jgi:hypothetical protein